jgi:hypothetical protein
MEQKDPQYCKEVIAQSILQMEELIKKINGMLIKFEAILADTNHPIPSSKKAEKKFISYYSIIQDQYID